MTWGAFPDHLSVSCQSDHGSEDQQRINTFSKLNTRVRALEAKLEDIKVGASHNMHVFALSYRHSNRKRLLMIYQLNSNLLTRTSPCCNYSFRNISSASQDSSRYKIGETFLHLPLPKALKRLERDQKDVDERFIKVAGEVEDIETKMKELKVVLYAKFGKAINLEE